ncbi:MAG: hypothetical protein IK115_01830 [Lachnospiraceae bacterium]|nr:hypothetical protein [Lachnospiraceae bacterium]
MKTIIIYDDTGRKSEVIADIIGERGFADVVVKKRRLEEYYRDELLKEYPDAVWKRLRSVYEYTALIKELELLSSEDARILHCFSNYLISDAHAAGLSFKKLPYVDDCFALLSEKRSVAGMFPNVREYLSFCRAVTGGAHAWDLIRNMKEHSPIDGVVDIGTIGNFIQCITGNFDSRYFNRFRGNEYTLVKSSSDKKKIKAEYTFYHLLPDDMKFWFVIPFDYRETETEASYTMERLHMTDLAIKWVHGSMDSSEFEELLDKYFYFFASRHSKDCEKEQCRKVADALYVDKVKDRIEQLKKTEGFRPIEKLLAESDADIDRLAEKYFRLKKAIEKKNKYPSRLVIGHGDPCFANTLYNKATRTLKFIDPKGAMTEEELWTDPYYDVAKLSHSVCGRYDFFNNALFDIRVDADFSFELDIPFDNSEFKGIFRRKAEENGFDYLSVRIYEASLFLSMLPLHMDNPHKVLALILNAKNILKEIEKDA